MFPLIIIPRCVCIVIVHESIQGKQVMDGVPTYKPTCRVFSELFKLSSDSKRPSDFLLSP